MRNNPQSWGNTDTVKSYFTERSLKMGLFSDNLAIGGSVPRHINGITCDVKNCAFHDGDNYCTASRVTIVSIVSRSSESTRCATFEPRGEITKKY